MNMKGTLILRVLIKNLMKVLKKVTVHLNIKHNMCLHKAKILEVVNINIRLTNNLRHNKINIQEERYSMQMQINSLKTHI